MTIFKVRAGKKKCCLLSHWQQVRKSNDIVGSGRYKSNCFAYWWYLFPIYFIHLTFFWQKWLRWHRAYALISERWSTIKSHGTLKKINSILWMMKKWSWEMNYWIHSEKSLMKSIKKILISTSLIIKCFPLGLPAE